MTKKTKKDIVKDAELEFDLELTIEDYKEMCEEELDKRLELELQLQEKEELEEEMYRKILELNQEIASLKDTIVKMVEKFF